MSWLLASICLIAMLRTREASIPGLLQAFFLGLASLMLTLTATGL